MIVEGAAIERQRVKIDGHLHRRVLIESGLFEEGKRGRGQAMVRRSHKHHHYPFVELILMMVIINTPITMKVVKIMTVMIKPTSENMFVLLDTSHLQPPHQWLVNTYLQDNRLQHLSHP